MARPVVAAGAVVVGGRRQERHRCGRRWQDVCRHERRDDDHRQDRRMHEDGDRHRIPLPGADTDTGICDLAEYLTCHGVPPVSGPVATRRAAVVRLAGRAHAGRLTKWTDGYVLRTVCEGALSDGDVGDRSRFRFLRGRSSARGARQSSRRPSCRRRASARSLHWTPAERRPERGRRRGRYGGSSPRRAAPPA